MGRAEDTLAHLSSLGVLGEANTPPRIEAIQVNRQG